MRFVPSGLAKGLRTGIWSWIIACGVYSPVMNLGCGNCVRRRSCLFSSQAWNAFWAVLSPEVSRLREECELRYQVRYSGMV